MTELLLRISGLQLALRSGANRYSVVDGLDLEIDQGETFALVGESGCGKSMTALSLMRLLPSSVTVDQGEIVFNGIDILDLDQRSMRQLRGGQLAMVFQEPMSSLNPLMKIGRQIGEAVQLHSELRGSGANRRIVELLQAVAIPDPRRCMAQYPHQLSGGMKQRVMIAMALAGDPKLLIADEPTTALDVTMQAQILGLLKRLQRERGMSILLITHDLGVVAEMADRVAVMYAGEIVEGAAVAPFFRVPRHPYSRMLFASLPERRRRGEKLAAIEGAVPPLGSEFRGCRFAGRCDQGRPICEQKIPPWLSGENRSGVRCLLYAENGLRPGSRDGVRAIPLPASGRGGEPLLSVENLQVHFPVSRGLLQGARAQLKAVDGVDLQIARGSVVALVGESGCGKSTLGKAILQLIDITRGGVTFDGRELTGMKGRELRRMRGDLQIIFQDPVSSMNPRMRVADIVAEGLRAQRNDSGKELGRRIESLLRQVGLPASAAERYPHEFSGGQRQRICVARALAVEPRLIVCDEPTSALDLSVQAQILNLLKGLQHQFQLSYLFISHDISVVAYMADAIAVMYLGRIVERGLTHEVMDNPMHPYTRALLGSVPIADPESTRQVIRLTGEMPSPVAPPSGCHFHPRCPRVEAGCETAYPEEVRITESHRVRCRLFTRR
ncbi:MAG: ABC transporter ATP-binding protein [gamma proteobacterium symbiont of Ctena orbiculata]|nr:MAG: ABC transporter ATP-binding protein [gamma proteobacterium symbiont of Ctena orbiculata]PVV13339.1 MAG: ABC transporter ATP-binding protein [gamma proteobacterium symbiont of Ctena orbiculata]PVV16405.1 MAG: ABC transporter ATP-binding protein [gamma proteobacterium symbiont of Ctena orbiculata]PVV21562.1 MAG: ABC transporter ATP-binding protein [gamma proteobacterium symbiont of Ctena orbiculata]